MVERKTIDAETFAAALKVLGWSYAKAADELGIHSRQRVADFARGRRKVPAYHAAHLKRIVDQSLKRRGL